MYINLVSSFLEFLFIFFFFRRGEGDDDCTLEEDFNKWKKKLWPTLCKHMGLDTAADASVEDEKLYLQLTSYPLFLLLKIIIIFDKR